jgi:hypothetical protein
MISRPPRHIHTLRDLLLVVLLTTVAVLVAASAARAASGDSVSGQSYNLGSGNTFTITFKNSGGYSQRYDYVQVPSGVSVTAGTFTSGAGGTFVPGGGGSANTGEWQFSGTGLPVGGTFKGTFTTSAAFSCGTATNTRARPRGSAAGAALLLYLNSTADPSQYTAATLPYAGRCSAPTPPPATRDRVYGGNYSFGVDDNKPPRRLIDVFGGYVQNPSSTAPSNPATISLDSASIGMGYWLDSFTGPGITGSTPTFTAPSLPPAGQLKWTATMSLKLSLTPGQYGDYKFDLNVDHLSGYGYELLVNDPLATFFKSGTKLKPFAARAAATRTRIPVLAGKFTSSIAGRTNVLAPGYPDPNAVVRVQLALVRSTARRGARSARVGSCFYYKGGTSFRRASPGAGGCTALIWRATKVVASASEWVYDFNPSRPLPAGNYTAFVRAITRAGLGDPSITNQFTAAPYRHAFVCRPGKC